MDYRSLARKAAEAHGLRPEIFLAQIQQESGFNPHARSPAGAQGIAQIMPATAKGWGVNPMNPKAALNAAARNMAKYVDQFGNYEDALRAYNAGPGNVKASHGFAETNNYVKTILHGAKGSATGREGASSLGSSSAGGASTRTIPGVDNSAQRAAIQQQLGANATSFLQTPGSDMLDFAMQQRGLLQQRSALKDTASRTVTVPGQTPTSATGTTSSGGRPSSQLKEEIYNTGGKGFAVKNGQVVSGPGVYGAVWAGHKDHVHVASGPKQIVEVGKQAQKMGLHVGENSHFGGENPASHVPGSYHNKDMAIDVSGDPKKMAAFASWVKKHYSL